MARVGSVFPRIRCLKYLLRCASRCASRLPFQTCSSEKLDQQAEADCSDNDPWRITEEQLEYYTNQFKSLQPDLGALILGRGRPRRRQSVPTGVACNLHQH